MDPRDFCAIAEELRNGSSAAHCRSAINRAYYAAYNVAASYLREWGIPVPQDAKAHGDLRERLSSSGHQELTKASSTLRQLYKARERADYKMDASDVESKGAAETAIAWAHEFIQRVEAFHALPEADRRPPIVKMLKPLQGRTYRS